MESLLGVLLILTGLGEILAAAVLMNNSGGTAHTVTGLLALKTKIEQISNFLGLTGPPGYRKYSTIEALIQEIKAGGKNDILDNNINELLKNFNITLDNNINEFLKIFKRSDPSYNQPIYWSIDELIQKIEELKKISSKTIPSKKPPINTKDPKLDQWIKWAEQITHKRSELGSNKQIYINNSAFTCTKVNIMAMNTCGIELYLVYKDQATKYALLVPKGKPDPRSPLCQPSVFFGLIGDPRKIMESKRACVLKIKDSYSEKDWIDWKFIAEADEGIPERCDVVYKGEWSNQ